jgi:hypothetical protein
VVFNLTATGAAGAGFVTAWPDGRPRPWASNLNLDTPGQTRPNLVTVALDECGTGGVALYTQAGTDLIADVAGFYLLSTPPTC